MNNNRLKIITEFCFTLPSILWLTVFFLIPTILLIILAFKSSPLLTLYDNINNTDGIYSGFSNLGVYTTIIFRTLWISILSTVICIIIAIPIGYCIVKLPEYLRRLCILFIIIPFWINFLVRISAWKLFLSPDNVLFKSLLFFGIINENTLLIHNNIAVITVIVYTSLPFAILAIYSAADKFDFELIEAAYDLGANCLESFLYIFVPNIISGIKSGIILVLIPCLGSYVIPELIGNTSSPMVGNIVINHIFVHKNISLASFWLCALISIVLLIVLVCSLAVVLLRFLRQKG